MQTRPHIPLILFAGSLLVLLTGYLAFRASLSQESTLPTPTISSTTTITQTTNTLCGDGTCDAYEQDHPGICPADCSQTTSAVTSSFTSGGAKNTYFVTNPTSGSSLFVSVIYPTGSEADTSLSPLVLIPGSTEGSETFAPGGKKDAQDMADKGFAVYIFDPEGRGKSEGTEDNNGTIGQDGLAAIIKFASEQQSGKQVGVLSFSYGVTMATGALSRFTDLPVAFLIDWEGPIDRNDTGGCDADDTGHMKEKGCTNESFWKEREAINFVGKLTVPYLRIQSEKDHAQPDTLSAVRMINAAVSGTAPWVRLNNGKVGATYSESAPPAMLADTFDRVMMGRIGDYAKELFAS